MIRDIIVKIVNLLTNYRDIIRYLSINKYHHNIKNHIVFTLPVDLNKIQYLSYYEKFINIRIFNTPSINFPANVKYIILDFKRILRGSLIKIIPKTVTHLTLGNKFKNLIFDDIPDNITHLTLAHNYRTFRGNISSNIIQLIIKNKSVDPKKYMET